MLLFGHVGITLGATMLLAGVLQTKRFDKISDGFTKAVPILECSSVQKVSWYANLARYADIRLLLVGSLLPDIIDKSVGLYLFRETFSNGRIFSHTLLFLIIITAVGIYLFQQHQRVWLLTLSFGTFTHLILDEMWQTPQTLFWPFLGLAFARIEPENWLLNIFQALLSRPDVFIPEVVGLVILLWFGLVLVGRKKVGAFLKYGKAN